MTELELWIEKVSNGFNWNSVKDANEGFRSGLENGFLQAITLLEKKIDDYEHFHSIQDLYAPALILLRQYAEKHGN